MRHEMSMRLLSSLFGSNADAIDGVDDPDSLLRNTSLQRKKIEAHLRNLGGG